MHPATAVSEHSMRCIAARPQAIVPALGKVEVKRVRVFNDTASAWCLVPFPWKRAAARRMGPCSSRSLHPPDLST
jgi:hypothetical protein